MRASGKEIVEDALGLLGVVAPGEPAEERLIAQALRFAESKIEELYSNAAAIPGVTIQDLAVVSGQSEYWLGPTGDAQTPPGLKTSGAPSAIVDAAAAAGGVEFPSVELVEDLDRWREVKRGRAIRLALYLHGGSGGSGVAPGNLGGAESYRAGNRRLEVFPAPRSGFTLRLYMRVPEIQSIDRDTVYDLPPGVHRLLTTNIADALLSVHGADPSTEQTIRNNAGMASAEYQKKNLRGSRGAAYLDPRWVTSVAVGDDYVNIPDYD